MRNYIVASWNDADQYDYSGEQIGNRLSKSQRVHFNPDGSACVASYADPEVKSKVSIKDRILPQAKRLTTLREQMLELENSYRSDEMGIQEYSLLRDLIVVKIDRATELYKKAIARRPIRPETYEDEGEIYASGVSPPSDDDGHGESYSSPIGVGFIDEVVDGLSSENSLKGLLKFSCKAIRGLLNFKIKFSKYIEELKSI